MKLVRAPSKPACNGKSIGSGSTRLGEYLVPVSKKLGGWTDLGTPSSAATLQREHLR